MVRNSGYAAVLIMASRNQAQIGKTRSHLSIIFWLAMGVVLLLGTVGLLVSANWKSETQEHLRQEVIRDVVSVLPNLSFEHAEKINDILTKWGERTAEEKFGPIFVRDMAIAFIIAVFLTVTIELYAGRKLRSEVSEDVLSGVFRKIMPDIIFEEVKSNVIQAGVLRKDWQIRMRPTKGNIQGEQNKDLYVSDTVFRYAIENLLNRPQNHELSSGLSLDIVATDSGGKPLPRFVKVSLDDKEFEGDDLKGYLNEGGNRLTMPITLPSARSSPTVVQIEVREIVRVPDAWYWATATPADGATIHIDASATPELEFKVEPYHSNKTLLEEPIAGQQWVFKGGILPWQGFEICVTTKATKVSEKKLLTEE